MNQNKTKTKKTKHRVFFALLFNALASLNKTKQITIKFRFPISSITMSPTHFREIKNPSKSPDFQ